MGAGSPTGVTSGGLSEVTLAGGLNKSQGGGSNTKIWERKSECKNSREEQTWQGKGRRLRVWKALVSNGVREEGRGQMTEDI